MVVEEFDHGDPLFVDDPHPSFRFGRAQRVIRHGSDRWPFVSLFRYEDVRRALADWRVWSSEIPAIRELLLGDASIMVQDDPPRHTTLRQCVAESVLPSSLAKLDCRVDHLVERHTEGLFHEAADAVEEVGARIALDLVSQIVGLQQSDQDYLRDWTNRFSACVGQEFVSTDEDVLARQRDAVALVHEEMSEFLRKRIKDHQKKSGLLLASEDWPMSLDERVGLIKSISFAGNHTTALMVANTLWLFATNPGELYRLRSGASVSAAVEEVLRYKAVFRGITRIATAPGSIGDVPYFKGDNLILWLASANFDEAKFPNPETFDITRRGRSHLAFAAGPHHCVGANLVRAQLKSLVQILQSRVEKVVIEAEPIRISDPWVDAFESLQVRLVEKS